MSEVSISKATFSDFAHPRKISVSVKEIEESRVGSAKLTDERSGGRSSWAIRSGS